jgi:U2-associated protein SR140
MTNSRRTKSTGLSGFVSFMKRKDAEQALRELDGFDWGGSILRVGWSKAVPIAQKPMYSKKLNLLNFPLFNIYSIWVGQNDRFRTPAKSQSIPVSTSRKASPSLLSALSQSMEPQPLRVAAAIL